MMLLRSLPALLLWVALTGNAAQAPPNAGLVLWLDAADASSLTLDTQNRVQRWSDKSGQSHDARVDEGTEQPQKIENAVNGHAVVRLSGTSAFMGKNIRSAKGPVTVLVVSRRLPEQAGVDPWQRLFSSRAQTADNDNVLPNFAISLAQTTAYEPTVSVLELQGVPIGPYAVGRNAVGTSENFRGDIAEVLVYDRPFASLAERQQAFSVPCAQVVSGRSHPRRYVDPCRSAGHAADPHSRLSAAVRSNQCRTLGTRHQPVR
ncbi:hypothetical protein [Pseudomonas sp. S3_H04]